MKESTISRMFLNRVEEGGDGVRYLVPRDGRWEPVTYREVGAAVREMAAGLMSLELKRGEKVAILSSTRLEWSLADYAGIVGGFVTVPIYPSNLPDQVEYILAHSGSRVVFVEDEAQRNKVEGSRARLPSLIAVVQLAGEVEEKEGLFGLGAFRARGAAYAAANPASLEARVEETRPEDDLTIIYTSGTTGPPKGAVIRHSNFVSNVTAVLKALDVRRGEVMLHFLPFAHVIGRFEHFLSFDAMVLSAFARGLQTVAEDLPAVRPHIMASVPRLYEKVYAGVRGKVDQDGGLKKAIFLWALGVGREVSKRLQRGEPVGGILAMKNSLADRLVFGKIRARMGGRLLFFVSGGAPLSQEIAEFFHALGILILEGYGMTETPTVSSINRPERYKFGSVGLPVEGVEIRIAGDGEILVRGPHVFKEYFRDPAATREAIDAEGWFHTGDIGALDQEGFLRITDRKKDIIVTSGGKNIAPQNIENLMKGEKLISQAFVFGDKRKFLTAILTLNAEEIVKWAVQNGIAETDVSVLAKHPRVLAKVRASVDGINRGLATFEQVKKFVLLGSDFTQESGELTPTLKVRRKVVLQKYGSLLDALYEGE